MALAYGKPLLLCSQEPRRHPYFMIGDMQMSFWADEDELAAVVRRWVEANGPSVARRVFNHELPSPVIAPPRFTYDPGQGFVGPGLRYAGAESDGPAGARRPARRRASRR
jgi:hypothetical protein